MMKGNFLILSIILALFFIGFLLLKKTAGRISPQSAHTQATIKKNYFPKPGKVANVFGWGYHRTSCSIPDSDQNILFFYAEDQNLYYTFTDNLENSHKVELKQPINPDYNVYCNNEKLYITYTDPNQGHLFMSTGTLYKNKISLMKHEHIISGRESYTIVAPHMRLLNGSAFIAFMDYGRVNTAYPNSKGKIVYKVKNKWIEQTVIEQSAEKTQVLGISLETFKNTLIAIMAPYPGDMYFSTFDIEKKVWLKPQPLLNAKTGGQLEWETISDEQNNAYLIFRDEQSGMSLASLHDIKTSWTIKKVTNSLSSQAFSIFKMEDGRIFILFNDAQLVSIDKLNQPVKVTEIKSKELYFLQVARRNSKIIYPFWLSGTDGNHIIEHASFDIQKYFP